MHAASSRLSSGSLRPKATERSTRQGCGDTYLRLTPLSTLAIQVKYCFAHLPNVFRYVSVPTTASTFCAVGCDDFCKMRVRLYWMYCKRAFGKPLAGKARTRQRKMLTFSVARSPSPARARNSVHARVAWRSYTFALLKILLTKRATSPAGE